MKRESTRAFSRRHHRTQAARRAKAGRNRRAGVAGGPIDGATVAGGGKASGPRRKFCARKGMVWRPLNKRELRETA